ncbi:MAG TPA: oligosaccharide flippase family protein [Syntrophobacteraceae bacterium]|nr:oligosaccharide flippase family protein [Syntrophobacteraceae bacterium]
MGKVAVYTRNLATNYLGYSVNLVAAFIVSPYFVHILGNARYGIWALLISVTGYLGLIELGVMASTGRYINYYYSLNDSENLSKILNTSLCFYSLVSCAILGAALVVQPWLGTLFPKIPRDLLGESGQLLILFGIGIYIGFLSSLFRQLLICNERFDLQNLSDITIVIVRSAVSLYLLFNGGGLLALALNQIVFSLLGCSFLFCLAKSYGPPVRYSARFVSKSTWRTLFNFGVFAFIGDMASQIIFYTSSILITLLLGVEAVTFYSIALMLIDNTRRVVYEIVRVMTPDILKLTARESMAEVQNLVLRGTRTSMFVAVPILMGLIVFGNQFVSLWMGPQYTKSAVVLMILAVGSFASSAARPLTPTLLGLNQVRFWSFVSVIEALLNMCLSVLMVIAFKLDIYGVALGTAIPMILISGFVLPVLSCRRIGMNFSAYFRKTFARWFIASVLTGLLFFAISALPIAANWRGFSSKVICAIILYLPVGILVLLGPDDRRVLLPINTKLRSRLGGGKPRPSAGEGERSAVCPPGHIDLERSSV